MIEAYKREKPEMVVGTFCKLLPIGTKMPIRYFEADKLLRKKDLVEYAHSYLRKPNQFILFGYSWGRLFLGDIIRKHYVRFNESLRTYEDVEFNFEYLKYVSYLLYIDKEVYNYRVNTLNVSATMNLFGNPINLFGYRNALEKIREYLKEKDKLNEYALAREIGHAYTTLTIIQFVRLCGQINFENIVLIYKCVKNIVSTPAFQQQILCYQPAGADSRILPILMKWKWIWMIIFVCKYKFNRRYK